MKKDRSEYLRKKELKQNAKRKESEHKIDYSNISDKNYKNPSSYIGADPLTEMFLLTSIMRAKRKNQMWGKPQNKERES